MAKRQYLKVGTKFGDWIVFEDTGKVNNRHQAIVSFKCKKCGKVVERLVEVAKRSSRCQQCYLRSRKGKHLKPKSKLSLATKTRLGIATLNEQTKFQHLESKRTNEYNKKMRLTPTGRSHQLFHGAKQRAAQEQVPFTITKEWINEKIETGKCEVTGIPFDFISPGFNKVNKFAPSLDRKDKFLGYTPQNTQVVVWFYNTAKNTFSHQELIDFAQILVDLDSKQLM